MKKITAQTPIHVAGYGYMTLELLHRDIQTRIDEMQRFTAAGDYANAEYIHRNLEPMMKTAASIQKQMEAQAA